MNKKQKKTKTKIALVHRSQGAHSKEQSTQPRRSSVCTISAVTNICCVFLDIFISYLRAPNLLMLGALHSKFSWIEKSENAFSNQLVNTRPHNIFCFSLETTKTKTNSALIRFASFSLPSAVTDVARNPRIAFAAAYWCCFQLKYKFYLMLCVERWVSERAAHHSFIHQPCAFDVCCVKCVKFNFKNSPACSGIGVFVCCTSNAEKHTQIESPVQYTHYTHGTREHHTHTPHIRFDLACFFVRRLGVADSGCTQKNLNLNEIKMINFSTHSYSSPDTV